MRTIEKTLIIKKYTTIIDGLKILFKTNEEFTESFHFYLKNISTDKFRFERVAIKNSSYRYEVYRFSEFIGFLSITDGKSRQKYTTLIFSNCLLYSSTTEYLIKLIIEIAECLNFSIVNISVIDIAIDSPECFYTYIQVAYKLNIKRGKYWDKIFFNPDKKSLSSHSDSYSSIRIYNKSIELNSKSKDEREPNKQYIKEFWQHNKMPINGMYRFEISLKNKYLKPKGITGIHGIQLLLENLNFYANKFLADNLKIINHNNEVVPLIQLGDVDFQRVRKLKNPKVLHFAENHLQNFFMGTKASLIHFFLDTQNDDAYKVIQFMIQNHMLNYELIQNILGKYNGTKNLQLINTIFETDSIENLNYLKFPIPQSINKWVVQSVKNSVNIKIKNVKSNLYSSNGGVFRFHYYYD